MCKSCEAVEIFVANVTEFPSGSNKAFEINGLVFNYDSSLDVVLIPEVMRGNYNHIDADCFEAFKKEQEEPEKAKQIDKLIEDLLPSNFKELPVPLQLVGLIKTVEKAKELYGKGWRVIETEENQEG
ncbi:hypothetical protein [Vibrio phage vB_VpM-pA2SJ1]|uniref:Uncharacterized protein n=1 Tax=Vibrio phage vB_VpM-pA2SJ1 TaxID=3095964 RepID=A0AAX4J5A5_9CAUD